MNGDCVPFIPTDPVSGVAWKEIVSYNYQIAGLCGDRAMQSKWASIAKRELHTGRAYSKTDIEQLLK